MHAFHKLLFLADENGLSQPRVHSQLRGRLP